MTSKLNILVTGGNGFIGKHLVVYLKKAGHTATVVDIDGIAPFTTLTHLQDATDFIKETDQGFDVIFHLAAIPRVGLGLNSPEMVLRNNIDSTIEVLGHCRQNPRTKLIFISSSSVAFSNLMINPYASSKGMCEELIELYRKTYGVKATTVRLFNVYGPGEARYGNHSTLIRRCKDAVLSDTDFTINGTGEMSRDFTHVDDVVLGLDAILKESQSSDEMFNHYELGIDQPISVNQVVERFFPKERIKYGPGRATDCQTTRSSTHYWPLGWIPSIHVLDYIDSWKAAGCPND